MRITIDNGDGRGAIDYTGSVTVESPITIKRTLNAPSQCTAEIVVGVSGLATPARRGRVAVTNDAGLTLFTGYLATEPVATFAGVGTTGPVYRARLTALSDEWLLDKQGSGANPVINGLQLGATGASAVAQLTQVAQASTSTGLVVAQGGSARGVGAFALQPAASWSTNAGAAANASYAAYRVVNGAVSVVAAGQVTHAFSDADGTLALQSFSVANVRELANDVTISGAEEAAAYVQEIFQGDGTTQTFELSQPVFRGSNRTLLKDNFSGASFDASQWALSGAGNHLQLSSAGLTMNGGNGYDGQTCLTAVNAIEMSGFVLAELSGVQFGAASDGMLAGFYTGTSVLPNCFAGFRVRQSVSTTGGNTVVVAMVNGAEAGTVFTPASGHRYTLRLRLFCVEMQRVPQRFYCMVDGNVQEFGAISGVNAPMQAVFEVVDEGASSNTPATVLYDTVAAVAALNGAPATCTFVAANSTSLFGSVSSLEVSRPGSLWISSTLPSGAQRTRLMGVAGQGVDCRATYGTAGAPGKITFFAGMIPVAGERITALYRTERRAVARLADAASVNAETAAGAGVTVPGVSRWLGKVSAPAARSSADCEAAAQAVLAMATARSASLRGEYATVNPAGDVWPGDLLQVTGSGVAHAFLVRSVEARDCHSVPEVLEYKISFANDWATEWADGLGLKLSETIAADTVLPPTAAVGPAQVLANLQQMNVVSLTSSALQIDAGLIPPAGGGFEVRLRDWNFGMGTDAADLVLRSPVRSFSIPRAAQAEQFYVRMYDASTPPLYSRWSSVLFVNWPVG